MTDRGLGAALYPRQIRHAVANWRWGRSLQVRLLLFVALVVAAGIAGVTYFQVRVIERTIEQVLIDTAKSTALTIADDLRSGSLEPVAITERLHDLIAADPAVQAATVIVREGPGISVIASTSSQERNDAVDLAMKSLDTGQPNILQTGPLTIVAAPVKRGDLAMAAVVSVSMAAVQQVRSEGRAIALWFAFPAIALVVFVVEILTRRLVHRRIALALFTMERVAAGDLSARAPIGPRDELGVLAEGLNEMLARIEHFNVELQQRVSETTTKLDDSYGRNLALREALGRAERMAALGQMAANIAHQVGTPLNLISGYVQMLREDKLEPRSRERLEVVQRQIQQVTRVLRSMLDQVRQPTPRETSDLTRIIGHVCESVQPRAQTAGAKLAVKVVEPLPLIEGDSTQLEAALLNLITNSLDALAGPGTVTISASATDHGVHLEIADTGPGFLADVLPRVFEPWVTTKPIGQGSGLGLAIAREVVKAHGGRIDARNRSEGGAVVSIDLPRGSAAAPKES